MAVCEGMIMIIIIILIIIMLSLARFFSATKLFYIQS
jgi:hypothetical protein